MSCALYAGTFDPPTNGHLWVALEGMMLFDKVIVGVADNPKKKPVITAEERVNLWHMILDDSITDESERDRIRVIRLTDEYTVRHAKIIGCDYLLRGIRTVQDYHDEYTLQSVNHQLEPSVRPVYLMAPPDLTDISSSMIKGMVGYNGWTEVVRRYVPKQVLAWLNQLHEEDKL